MLWTLVDSDASQNGVPGSFVAHDTSFFVILATPPTKDDGRTYTRLFPKQSL